MPTPFAYESVGAILAGRPLPRNGATSHRGQRTRPVRSPFSGCETAEPCPPNVACLWRDGPRDSNGVTLRQAFRIDGAVAG